MTRTGTSSNPTESEIEEDPSPFEHFGAFLRFYRETYGERMQYRDPAMPRVKLTALALVDCLQRRGYAITSGTLSEIESGINIPRDPDDFVDRVSACLGLERRGEDWRALLQYLAYDIVKGRVSKEIADLTVRRPLPVWVKKRFAIISD